MTIFFGFNTKHLSDQFGGAFSVALSSLKDKEDETEMNDYI